MDPPNILETLAAHDKVHTMAEVIEWKKTVSKKSLREKRESAVTFFGNDNLSKNLVVVEKAINSIPQSEKTFKMNLKNTIAKEEYDKCSQVPKIYTQGTHSNCSVPAMFLQHACRVHRVFKDF